MTRIDGSNLSAQTFDLLKTKKAEKLTQEDVAKIEASIVADGQVNESESQLLAALTQDRSGVDVSKGKESVSVSPLSEDVKAAFGQLKERLDGLKSVQAALSGTSLASFKTGLDKARGQISSIEEQLGRLKAEQAKPHDAKAGRLLDLQIRSLETELRIIKNVVSSLDTSVKKLELQLSSAEVKKLDADGDGKLNQAEIKAAFAVADRDGNQSLSSEELNSFKQVLNETSRTDLLKAHLGESAGTVNTGLQTRLQAASGERAAAESRLTQAQQPKPEQPSEALQARRNQLGGTEALDARERQLGDQETQLSQTTARLKDRQAQLAVKQQEFAKQEKPYRYQSLNDSIRHKKEEIATTRNLIQGLKSADSPQKLLESLEQKHKQLVARLGPGRDQGLEAELAKVNYEIQILKAHVSDENPVQDLERKLATAEAELPKLEADLRGSSQSATEIGALEDEVKALEAELKQLPTEQELGASKSELAGTRAEIAKLDLQIDYARALENESSARSEANAGAKLVDGVQAQEAELGSAHGRFRQGEKQLEAGESALTNFKRSSGSLRQRGFEALRDQVFALDDQLKDPAFKAALKRLPDAEQASFQQRVDQLKAGYQEAIGVKNEIISEFRAKGDEVGDTSILDYTPDSTAHDALEQHTSGTLDSIKDIASETELAIGSHVAASLDLSIGVGNKYAGIGAGVTAGFKLEKTLSGDEHNKDYQLSVNVGVLLEAHAGIKGLLDLSAELKAALQAGLAFKDLGEVKEFLQTFVDGAKAIADGQPDQAQAAIEKLKGIIAAKNFTGNVVTGKVQLTIGDPKDPIGKISGSKEVSNKNYADGSHGTEEKFVYSGKVKAFGVKYTERDTTFVQGSQTRHESTRSVGIVLPLHHAEALLEHLKLGKAAEFIKGLDEGSKTALLAIFKEFGLDANAFEHISGPALDKLNSVLGAARGHAHGHGHGDGEIGVLIGFELHTSGEPPQTHPKLELGIEGEFEAEITATSGSAYAKVKGEASFEIAAAIPLGAHHPHISRPHGSEAADGHGTEHVAPAQPHHPEAHTETHGGHH
ncbi:MAG TPA: hypothetical protein V6D23_15885 [Candidatus Obscuribacterales bacterium]